MLFYGATTFMEFLALLRLRRLEPSTPRPYKIPLSGRWLELAALPPMILCVLLAFLAPWEAWALFTASTIAGTLARALILRRPIIPGRIKCDLCAYRYARARTDPIMIRARTDPKTPDRTWDIQKCDSCTGMLAHADPKSISCCGWRPFATRAKRHGPRDRLKRSEARRKYNTLGTRGDDVELTPAPKWPHHPATPTMDGEPERHAAG